MYTTIEDKEDGLIYLIDYTSITKEEREEREELYILDIGKRK